MTKYFRLASTKATGLYRITCAICAGYTADIRYDIHSKLYVMESAGIFHVNLRINESEITALSAGLSMAAHFLPHLRVPARSLWEKLGKYMPAEILSLLAWHVIPGDSKIPVKVRITEPLAETFREVGYVWCASCDCD